VVDPTAALGDRMIATVLDSLLLGVVIAAVALIAAQRWELIPESLISISTPAMIGMGAFAFLVLLLYFWLCEGLFGATLGKSLTGIRVTRSNGREATLRDALVRTLLRLVDGLGFYFLGFVVAIFSGRRQRIGDHMAGTVVVNQPPTAAARAGVLVLWLGLIGGALFGVWKTVEPVRAWVEAARLQQTVVEAPTPAVTPSGELVLGKFAWLSTPDGPSRESNTFRPGERSWASYTLSGFGENENGEVNVMVESSALDPSGVAISKPLVVPVLDLAPKTPLERIDPLEIPPYAPGGPYQLRIRVRDFARGRDASFVQDFVVDAPPVEPAANPEIRNFVFSIAKDGFPIDSALFDIGETAHYRFEVHGLQFVDDRIDAEISYKLLGPEGQAISFTPKWKVIQESHRYHPASFYLVQSGSVSLPYNARPGIYTLEHVVSDHLANETGTHTARFGRR
jgi:uncharacterized RDD family membrane protein YckC